MIQTGSEVSLEPLYVICGYLVLLLCFGAASGLLLRKSSSDYFVASRSIGSFLLLMSVFGTTMTAFTLVGSTGKAFGSGIGIYGLMGSASGIVHSLVFFLIGMKLWAIGKRYHYRTQIQYFRARFDSDVLGYLLFPVLVGLVIPYLLIGIVGAGAVVRAVTVGMFPEVFPGAVDPAGVVHFAGAVPPWLTGSVICGVVLTYVIAGGIRAAALANAAQTMLFMVIGILAFALISNSLGGLEQATASVADSRPALLAREGEIGHLEFLTYMFVPLSAGMFPHLFQHWLTAKSAKTFRVTVVLHPIFIMIVWVPCVLIGVWAAGAGVVAPGGNANAVLGVMVDQLQQPLVAGLLTAGILAAIMSSLDSQFVCLGTMFSHDIVMHGSREGRFTDRQQVALGRGFIVLIVAVTYGLSLLAPPDVFDMAVWCFSGFASLFPLVFASIYWRRVTRAGAIASVVVAAITWCILFFVVPMIEGRRIAEDYAIAGMMPVAIMVAVSAVTLIVVSLMTRPLPASVVDRFFDMESD